MTTTTHGKRTSSNAGSFEVVLPATSANLGPAFDAAALALKLFLKVRAKVAGDYSISATGRDEGICSRIDSHLILTTYREILRSEGKPAQPLSLNINNDIPIGKGCGSSAAARLAGIALAVQFGTLRWTESRIIGEASRREHHADNAAACWLGGLTVARMASGREAETVSITAKGRWPLLLAIPDQSLSTEKARLVLPPQYSRQDAVANIQNCMFLLAAFIQGRADLLSSALADRMHQPYRSSLCPLLPALQQMPRSSGILGVALSGAGPSVLVFVDPEASVAQVTTRVKSHLRLAGLSPELVPTTITERGGNSSARSFRR